MPFRTSEISLLTEYCHVMQPLARSLDILQVENKCFIGYLLPTLTSLETKLRQLRPQIKGSSFPCRCRFAGFILHCVNLVIGVVVELEDQDDMLLYRQCFNCMTI